MSRHSLLVSLLVVLSFTYSSSCFGSDDDKRQVAKVVILLDKMAGWPLLPIVAHPDTDADATERIRKTEECVYEIAQYDLEIVRKAYEKYLEGHTKTPVNRDNLLIVNKFLFDIPETVKGDSPHWRMLISGGGAELPRTGIPGELRPTDTASARWPWEEDKKSRLWHLQGKRVGRSLFGRPYPAVEVFDYYRANFKRRDVKPRNA